MLTIGVDLAAEPKKTGLASIEWSADSAVVCSLTLGTSNAQIVDASRGAASVGIDCPFVWPIEFVEFVFAHSRREVAPSQLAGADWRGLARTGADWRGLARQTRIPGD
jgi:predicted nuclease with RNAse H fold